MIHQWINHCRLCAFFGTTEHAKANSETEKEIPAARIQFPQTFQSLQAGRNGQPTVACGGKLSRPLQTAEIYSSANLNGSVNHSLSPLQKSILSPPFSLGRVGYKPVDPPTACPR